MISILELFILIIQILFLSLNKITIFLARVMIKFSLIILLLNFYN